MSAGPIWATQCDPRSKQKKGMGCNTVVENLPWHRFNSQYQAGKGHSQCFHLTGRLCFNQLQRKRLRSWKDSPMVRALAILPEDPDLVPNTYFMVHNCQVTRASRNPMLSSGLHRHWTPIWYPHTRIIKTPSLARHVPSLATPVWSAEAVCCLLPLRCWHSL